MFTNPSTNTTLALGLGLLNTTLRIAIDCKSRSLWFEPDPSGVGVIWQGRTAWDFADMKSRIGVQYEVVTKLPESERNLHPRMLALMKGVADISIEYWGVNYKRSQLIDFSYPVTYHGVYIFSSGNTAGFIHADLVLGVFDKMSYGFAFFSLAAMILISWIINSKEDKKQSSLISACFLYILGNASKQPLNPSIVPKALFRRTIMTIFSIYNYILCIMYGSVVVSVLTSGVKPPQINSLEDLNKTENMNIRIFLEEKSYIQEFLKSANMLNGFDHRIDYINTYDDQNKSFELIHHVLQGSHVFLTSCMCSQLCKTKRVTKSAAANLEDFRKSRSVSRHK